MAASYTITVPGTAEYLITLRLFVGAVARSAGLDEALVGDLKLAVSEIATAAMVSGLPAVDLIIEDGEGIVSIHLPKPVAPSDDDIDHLDVARALFDGSVESRDDQVVLTMASPGGEGGG
ncbi:MAG: ATP-binding protein [Acidimicrobiia bacterium]